MYRNTNPGVNPRRLLLLIVTATAMLGIASPARAASDSESHGRIAFSKLLPDGGADVFIVNPDGSHVHQVPLRYPAEDFAAPIWSPDGTRLLISHLLRFDSAGELLPFRPAIVRPDGSHFTVLEMPDAPFDMDCTAWLPSGTRILCGFGGDSPGIFSVSTSDGAHSHATDNHTAGSARRPPRRRIGRWNPLRVRPIPVDHRPRTGSTVHRKT